MTQTQLASMYLGAPLSYEELDQVEGEVSQEAISQIHIIDGQSGEILDHIQADKIIDDNHKKNLETYLETYDAITIGGLRFDEFLEKRNRIVIFDEDYTLKEFVLFEVDKYRDSEGRKTHLYSHASYLELKKAGILYPERRANLNAGQHVGWALNNTGWRVGLIEAEGTRTLTIENHTNPYEFLKRIAREFEVELRFRIEHNGNRVTGRYVDLLERIGEWRGREIEFGRDLDGIRRKESQDIVTALLGLGPEGEDGKRLEVLVEDSHALQRWGRVDENGNLHHLIETYEIQSSRTEMTEAEARQYTRTALNKRINSQVEYETSVVDLENVPGMENKKIRFGDTLRIKDTHFVPPLYLEARVFEMNRSIKSQAKKDIKLGDYIEYTEEEVHAVFNQLRNEIRQRVSVSQMEEYTYDKPTIDSKDEQSIDSSKGYTQDYTYNKQDIDSKDGAVQQRAYNYSDDKDTRIRDDMRLQSALPTSISHGDFGIRATASGSGKYAQLDHRGVFVKGGAIQIERPDGALWVEDGLMKQGYSINGFDPHFTDTKIYDSNGQRSSIFADQGGVKAFDGWYEAPFAWLDGRSSSTVLDGFRDVRDDEQGYTIRFQRYEFLHSSRYIRFDYRIARNNKVGKHRVRIIEVGTAPSGYDEIYLDEIFEEGDRGLKRLVIDLGKPTYEVREVDFRLGHLRQWGAPDKFYRFRINRVVQYDIL